MIKNKTNRLWLLLLLISFYTQANDNPKFISGDCITPIKQNYSWFGKFAQVEAYTSIDGYSGKNYILRFYNYKSNSVIFSKSIERSTKKVDTDFCQLDEQQELYRDKKKSANLETVKIDKSDYLNLIVSSYVNGFNEFDTSVTADNDYLSIGIYFDISTKKKERAEQLAKRFRAQIPLKLRKYNWANNIKTIVSVYSEDKSR